MSSGGKGGGTDTGPMLEYGNKALKLQEKIYKEGKQEAQPWYQTGTGAIGQLSTLMGIKPQNNAYSRQSLLDQYRPQFTTSQTTQGARGGLKDIRQMSPAERRSQVEAQDYYKKFGQAPPGYRMANLMGSGKLFAGVIPDSTGPTTTQSTDQSALNAYVDSLLAKQGAEAESNPLFGTLAKGFSMSDYQADPGYQFRLSEGNKALERQLNARGKTFSPEAVNALQSYGQGLASEEYGNAYGRFNQDQGNLFNRLATLSGFGQAAQAGQAAAGQNYAQSAGDLYTGMGNAITSANVARAANSGSMFNTLLGAGAQLGSAYFMSDERLKTDIELVREENGHKIYHFKYKTDPNRVYEGVMAQDVLEYMPDAVHKVGEYYAVNYPMLGIEMKEVTRAA